MSHLNIEPNLIAADAVYEALIEAHQDLTPEQSHEMNAALVLLLGNHIGAADVLLDALKRARSVVLPSDGDAGQGVDTA